MSPRIGLDLPTLLQAAADIADTRGIESVTLAELAKRFNIRTPSLYNHIGGLSDLRTRLAVYGLEQLYARMASAADGLAGEEAVHAAARAYLTFVRTRPGLYEAITRVPDPHNSTFQQAGQPIVELTVRLLSVFGLEGDAAIHGVRGLRSIVHGFASLERLGGFGLPLDPDTSFKLLVDSFLAGLHKMKEDRTDTGS